MNAGNVVFGVFYLNTELPNLMSEVCVLGK